MTVAIISRAPRIEIWRGIHQTGGFGDMGQTYDFELSSQRPHAPSVRVSRVVPSPNLNACPMKHVGWNTATCNRSLPLRCAIGFD